MTPALQVSDVPLCEEESSIKGVMQSDHTSCVVTRAQTRTGDISVADTFLLSLFSGESDARPKETQGLDSKSKVMEIIPISKENLATAQNLDPTLHKCFESMACESEIGREACLYVENGVLM